MKLGIVIHSNEAETVWNAFRVGVFALKQGDTVRVFLLGRGVEAEHLDTETFKVTAQMQAFNDGGGEILACGTCLQLRKQGETALCPISTMADLYQLIAESDKALTF